MKRDLFSKVSLVVVAVLLVLNLIVSLVSTSSPSYAAKTIQYKVVEVPSGPSAIEFMQSKLDMYGSEGWELVQFAWPVLIFKK